MKFCTQRMSTCDCLPVEDAEITLSDDESTKDVDGGGLRFRTLPTKITPIVFHKYQPLDLTAMNEQGGVSVQFGYCQFSD